MKKCGIYIIKNTINNKVYIGQSVNIEARWYAHKTSGKLSNKKVSYRTKIYPAMYSLGVENFYLEVLEYCNFELLNEREIYWIKKYDSFNCGYNMTEGGVSHVGEKNGRAILNEDIVLEIRSMYGERVPFRESYKHFEHLISKRGFRKVWNYETWLHISPEVYTDENRIWHSTVAKGLIGKDLGRSNSQRSCSEEEINKMRELHREGLSYLQISKIVGRSNTTVRKYCLFQESSKKKGSTAIEVKNIETGLVFDSLTSAGKWAKCSRDTIRKYINTKKTAGRVPTTNQPATWISL